MSNIYVRTPSQRALSSETEANWVMNIVSIAPYKLRYRWWSSLLDCSKSLPSTTDFERHELMWGTGTFLFLRCWFWLLGHYGNKDAASICFNTFLIGKVSWRNYLKGNPNQVAERLLNTVELNLVGIRLTWLPDQSILTRLVGSRGPGHKWR